MNLPIIAKIQAIIINAIIGIPYISLPKKVKAP